jgi:predicted nucleic acid-binding protein
MPEMKRIVINTGPLISLIAAIEDLTFLSSLYEQIFVPLEVCQEIESGGKYGFGINLPLITRSSEKFLQILKFEIMPNFPIAVK